jgi:glycosyltransferase involved in cell wall biosynthesis
MANIAILIPSYNSAKTIAETLESIQAQGNELRKISAVYLSDDCSLDDTVSIAEAVWKSKTPLKVLRCDENLGERGNVNRAMLIIKKSADWVLLLHSDDIAKPDWARFMISRIDACASNVGSLCSSWDSLMTDGSVTPGEDNLTRPVEVIDGTPESVRGTLRRGCWWHISGCAIRLSAFEDVGGFELNMPQMGDMEWLLRCLNTGWSVEYIPRTLISYRQHTASVSSASFLRNKDILESLEIVQRYALLLSIKELLCFHLRREVFVARRATRALLQANIKRSILAGVTSAQVLLNLLRCYRKRFTWLLNDISKRAILNRHAPSENKGLTGSLSRRTFAHVLTLAKI